MQSILMESKTASSSVFDRNNKQINSTFTFTWIPYKSNQEFNYNSVVCEGKLQELEGTSLLPIKRYIATSELLICFDVSFVLITEIAPKINCSFIIFTPFFISATAY